MPDTTPQAVAACHALLQWMVPHLDKFPRVRRFTLGERIETRVLDVLGNLIEAAYSREKRASLTRANLDLEVTKHLWRLCHELQVIPAQRYEHGAKLMHELGRQIGGWARSQHTREPKPRAAPEPPG